MSSEVKLTFLTFILSLATSDYETLRLLIILCIMVSYKKKHCIPTKLQSGFKIGLNVINK